MTNQATSSELTPPEYGTRAALSYFWANQCDLRLLHFLLDTAMTGDFVYRIAQDALEGKDDYMKLDPGKLARSDPGPRTKAIRASSQEFLEMFLSRIVDSFQVYIVEILREVLHKQPRILSASKQELTLGYVLQFDSIESLTKDWIEGKVASLSYEGFGDLEDWCKTRGIPLLFPEGEREKIVETIAIRNLIVHNRCIVDERYRKATGDTKFDVGQVRGLNVDDFFETMKLLFKVVKVTDGAVSGKFGLEQVDIRIKLTERANKKWPPTSQQKNAAAALPGAPADSPSTAPQRGEGA
jgi:hypothetical protein